MKLKLFVIGILIAITITAIFVINSGDDKKRISYPNTVSNSNDNPDENQITEDNYKWTGKATDPKKIVIKKLKVDGFIQKVSIDQRTEVGVPSNINLAGWFNQSSTPGKTGLSIIDGHIDGKTKPGIFYKLDKLKVNDTFEIELGSGKLIKYKVTSSTQVPKDKATEVLFSQDPSVKSQLNLITCGGSFDKKARHYDDRIIVTSIPI